MAFFTDAQRAEQDRFESRGLADAVTAAVLTNELDESQQAFIESRDFFFLSTVNDRGEPTVSYKGGDVGTVTVLDPQTIAFPAYDGNGMFLSLGNIQDTAKIGLLFIDFETPNRLRVQATARFETDSELLAKYPGAIGVVRAQIESVFVNCARYIHAHERTSSSAYVPDAEGNQPVATWKRIDGLQGVLPPKDVGEVAAAGGTISAEDYARALADGKS